MEASLDSLLAKIPSKNRHMLDWKIEDDLELTEIARKLTRWEGVLPFLGLKETDHKEISYIRNADVQT